MNCYRILCVLLCCFILFPSVSLAQAEAQSVEDVIYFQKRDAPASIRVMKAGDDLVYRNAEGDKVKVRIRHIQDSTLAVQNVSKRENDVIRIDDYEEIVHQPRTARIISRAFAGLGLASFIVLVIREFFVLLNSSVPGVGVSLGPFPIIFALAMLIGGLSAMVITWKRLRRKEWSWSRKRLHRRRKSGAIKVTPKAVPRS